ncbi:MAG: ABC transporter ATP-binding protein [Dictyoglomus sp.]|nr:ABC transporter ATP-binding protein [Dictyoglomus sp.]MCX7941898.1 ABC transporter ATP-binding protein [Dictyoglomaceae bacterium]MDW8188589.1 ABC transporter ATP-binding protein [Dictyoglomus sp.]
MNEIIKLEGIVKKFPGVIANDSINLSIKEGEIHAIVGENGAGKSTLMKILYGLYRPDKGKIFIRGKEVHITEPKVAISLGIGMVHQHFMLIPPFTVVENIILGSEPKKKLSLDYDRAVLKVKNLSESIGFNIDPNAKVESLSVGQAQRVEILKLLYRGADILILDEPTSVLAPQEVEELFNILKKLNAQGKTIIFISHKLNEVLAISHRVTVMRRGKVVKTLNTKETNKQELAQLMVGREVFLQVEKGSYKPGEEVLKVENLTVKNRRGLIAVKDVSFNIREGEIVGIAGVEGNGQSELVEALVGLLPIEKGKIYIKGKDVSKESVLKRRALLGHIPEDRHKRGLILDFSLAENAILGLHYLPNFSRGLFLDYKAIFNNAENLVKEYDVRTPNVKIPVRNLSGGNQQKIVAGREISISPYLLIASQPTRGLDIGATEFIYKLLVKLRDEGKAVLLVSADLDEILNLSDRILVMYNGKIVGSFYNKDIDEKELGYYMMGIKKQDLEKEALV